MILHFHRLEFAKWLSHFFHICSSFRPYRLWLYSISGPAGTGRWLHFRSVSAHCAEAGLDREGGVEINERAKRFFLFLFLILFFFLFICAKRGHENEDE